MVSQFSIYFSKAKSLLGLSVSFTSNVCSMLSDNKTKSYLCLNFSLCDQSARKKVLKRFLKQKPISFERTYVSHNWICKKFLNDVNQKLNEVKVCTKPFHGKKEGVCVSNEVFILCKLQYLITVCLLGIDNIIQRE